MPNLVPHFSVGLPLIILLFCQALERLRPYLVDKIIASRHFDYLRSRKILTRDDTEEINCRSTDRKRAGKLLDYLAENPRGLDTLIESIRRERTINFLITRITDEVQKVKNERIAALKGKEVYIAYIRLFFTELLF